MSCNVQIDPMKVNYAAVEPGEEVVITGLSGRFPESRNIMELKDNLMKKVDLITENYSRWRLGNCDLTLNHSEWEWNCRISTDHEEIPKGGGKLSDLSKFDAIFFGIHYKQADTLDPMCRMLLEHTYEAIVDAGLNPRQLKGTNTGVVIGSSIGESEKTWAYEKLQVNVIYN